jgi:hypothetical protein
MHDPGRHTCGGAGCESNPYLEIAMVSEQPGYRSYLLRLGQVGSADAPSWRVSLEDVRTRERRDFASLEQLVTFLMNQARSMTHSDDAAPDN